MSTIHRIKLTRAAAAEHGQVGLIETLDEARVPALVKQVAASKGVSAADVRVLRIPESR